MRRVQYGMEITEELDEGIEKRFPSQEGWHWERILRHLMGMTPCGERLPFRKTSPMGSDELRKTCSHPNPIIKTGLVDARAAGAEDKWLWCPRCNTLIRKVDNTSPH